MLLAVFGAVLYHLAQKFQPVNVSPFLILTLAYCAAAVLSFCLHLLMPFESAPLRTFALPALGLGVAVVVIELGFLAVYRAGWNIGVAGVCATAGATLVLVPIGIVVLQEKISSVNAVGMGLCLLGLLLTAKH
ncbi:MAG: hypothetical protein HC886_03330 [Leptolyngbyaceae cyanobacterium SM1_1_3]|nr:hypothetical protein [Leptolyngbyaceae cyanobacterium SM1_1_3]